MQQHTFYAFLLIESDFAKWVWQNVPWTFCWKAAFLDFAFIAACINVAWAADTHRAQKLWVRGVIIVCNVLLSDLLKCQTFQLVYLLTMLSAHASFRNKPLRDATNRFSTLARAPIEDIEVAVLCAWLKDLAISCPHQQPATRNLESLNCYYTRHISLVI